jgi:hypothetical protein
MHDKLTALQTRIELIDTARIEFTDLVAAAVANAQNRGALETSRDELTRLLAEQAALRRVATLVARGIDPAEIFSAVAGEFGRLLDADNAGISRFDPDGSSVVIVGSVGEDAATVPIGTRVEIPDYFAPGGMADRSLGPGRRGAH